MLLKEALDLFLQVDRSVETQATYRKFLARFVAAIGPERPLDLIQPEDLDAYVVQMRQRETKYADHPRRPVEHAPLSSSTIYKNVKMIKTFFNWCEKREYVQRSPARFLYNKRPGRPLGQGKAICDNELEAILVATRYQPRNRAVVLLLASSGCRAGEIARLRLPDLDLDTKTALIDGKGDIRRRIYYDEPTIEALRAWLAVRPKADHDYVFTARYGPEPLTPSAVSQLIRRLCKLVGIRSLGAHSLRHRVGLKFARARVAPRVTQHYLGHSDIKITLSYYQDVDESDLRAAGEMLTL